jgi:type I site-specific restriction endonuclease
MDDRTKLIARKVTEFLKESSDRFQKTIVFCVDQEHAARMRQALINENADLDVSGALSQLNQSDRAILDHQASDTSNWRK